MKGRGTCGISATARLFVQNASPIAKPLTFELGLEPNLMVMIIVNEALKGAEYHTSQKKTPEKFRKYPIWRESSITRGAGVLWIAQPLRSPCAPAHTAQRQGLETVLPLSTSTRAFATISNN